MALTINPHITVDVVQIAPANNRQWSATTLDVWPSAVNSRWRLSSVYHTQHPVLCTAQWAVEYDAVAWSTGISWYLWNMFSLLELNKSESTCTVWSKKTDPLVYFDDNFGKYGPILTIFSLLQQEIYGTQKLRHFSHLPFIMLPLYLAKRTLMLVSMSLLRHYCVCFYFVSF